MRIGLYSDHLYTDGQVGTGASKYIYYLTRELRSIGVDVVPLHKGENPADVDLLHDPHPPWNAPLWPRRPLVITIHDLAPATCPRYFRRWVRFLYIQKLRWFVRVAARVLVDSQRTNHVVQSILRPPVPIDVIPLGLEDRFRPLPGPRPDRPFIAQVGIHRPIKDPWATVRAYESIANRIDHELHFVGGRPDWVKPLEDYVARNSQLASRVKFGWPGEDGLPALYNQASLVVHPCPEEGFGFVPLEALACGAHVLARAPAVREILGMYGCYYEDEASYASAMLACLEGEAPGTTDERVRHAKAFTFQLMAKRTLGAFEAVLSS